MIAEGTWYLESESDPRWNRKGVDFIDGFLGPVNIDIDKIVEKLKKYLNCEPPADLRKGWMKF